MIEERTAFILQASAIAFGGASVGVGIGMLLATGGWLLVVILVSLGLTLMLWGGTTLHHNLQAIAILRNALTVEDNPAILPFSNPLPPNTPLTSVGESLTIIGQRLRRLLMQLQMQADQVRDAATRIGESVTQHNHNAIEQADAVSEVAATVTEFDQIVASVSELAHQVAIAAQESLQASQHTMQASSEVINALTAQLRQAQSTTETMIRLRAQAEQVGVISELIRDLADDTAILALNAAIEAAGAGAYGQRFNVIATEVRELAQRTDEGSVQVGQLIKELVEALLNTEQAVRNSLSQMQHTTATATTLTETTRRVNRSAAHTQMLANQIDLAMTQQRSGSSQVTTALTSIANASQRISEQSQAVTDRVNDLGEVAYQLRQSALRFGVDRVSHGRIRLRIAGRETVSQRGLAWQNLVDEWNHDNPSLAVALEFMPPSADYLTTISREISQGIAPDLIHLAGGLEHSLAQMGYLSSLDSILSDTVRNDFYPQAITPVNGTLYTLPTEAQPLVLFYNRALLERLKISPPQTWQELVTLGERCHPNTDWGVVVEANSGTFRLQHWLPFVWQLGALDSLVEPGQNFSLEQPAVAAAMQLYRDLFRTPHGAPLKPPHPSYDIANLAEGHSAMQYIGTWAMNMLRENYPQFDYGVVDLPLPQGGQPATMLLTWGLAVNSSSPQQQTALSFLRWALADDGPTAAKRIYQLTVEGLPVRRSVAEFTKQQKPDPRWLYLLEQVYPHSRTLPLLSDSQLANLDDLIEQAIQP